MYIFCYTKWEGKLKNKNIPPLANFLFLYMEVRHPECKIHSLLQQKCKKDDLQLYNIVSDPEEKTNLVRALLL